MAISIQTVRLLTGVSGSLYLTNNGTNSTPAANPVKDAVGYTPTTAQELSRIYLGDGNNGNTISGKISLTATGGKWVLGYNGTAFSSNSVFGLDILAVDIGYATASGVDTFGSGAAKVSGSNTYIPGAAAARINILPTAAPSVSSVSPTSVHSGEDVVFTVSLKTPVDSASGLTLVPTFAPSGVITSPVVTAKLSGTNIIGWDVKVTIPPQNKASVTFKGDLVAKGLTYLKGDKITTEDVTFVSQATLATITVGADTTPINVDSFAVSPTNAGLANSYCLTGNYTVGSGTLKALKTFYAIYGSVAGTLVLKSDVNNYGTVVVSLVNSATPTVSYATCTLSQGPVFSKTDSSGNLAYYKNVSWSTNLAAVGTLNSSGTFKISVTTTSITGVKTTYVHDALIIDSNIYAASLATVYISNSATPTVFSSGAPVAGATWVGTRSGSIRIQLLEYQKSRTIQSALTSGVKTGLISAYILFDDLVTGGTILREVTLNTPAPIGGVAIGNWGYTNGNSTIDFGTFDTKTWTNGAHKLTFHLRVQVNNSQLDITVGTLPITISNSVVVDPPGCVDYDSLISMAAGPCKRAIEVMVGDNVLVYNPITSDLESKPVKAVLKQGVKPCVEIHLKSGGKHICSESHRVYEIAADSFFEAKDLKVGDGLMTPQGGEDAITAISKIAPREVVTYTIDDPICRNYFADGILAHNMKPVDCVVAGTQISMADGTTKNVELIESGDVVLSYNPSTSMIEPNMVLTRFATKNSSLFHVVLENGLGVTCSGTHTFITKDNEWKNVTSMSAKPTSFEILTQDGPSRIKNITPVAMPSDTFVYLMEVENNRSLITNRIICHNAYKP